MLLEKVMEIFRALKEWPFDLLVASQDSACKWELRVSHLCDYPMLWRFLFGLGAVCVVHANAIVAQKLEVCS